MSALLLSVVFGVAGQLLMKYAAVYSLGAPATWKLAAGVALALLLYSVGVLNWILALRQLPLSVAYPLTSLNYIGILAGAHYFFAESISLKRVLGVSLIFCGVVLVTASWKRASAEASAGPTDPRAAQT
jgi:multidrug transporter EmrE-like cation transporter